ncbi:extracellular solute-binding protein [Pleurocapsales cyanobacterium LEGE 06147]|nr:extracellular solute-binding protein [Pleurocapsales cyanobacterium LEGE 06147]
MVSRRSFLISAVTIATAQLIFGCSEPQETLKVLLLEGSIPPQLLRDFRRTLNSGTKLNFQPETQLKQIFNLLQNWQKQAENDPIQEKWLTQLSGGNSGGIANLMTLGDYWLATAIQQQLIQPLDLTKLDAWSRLPLRWQRLVKRNRQGELDENGLVWGAPYRWGSTIIVYRRDRFRDLGWMPTDWSDLWREELRDRISLLDQPREVIGLTLKKLGYSYNTSDLAEVPNLKNELLALQQQVKFYSSDNYLQPLLIGDTWLAVGWSTDILPATKHYSNLKAVVPQSGTSLWADLWVQPRLVMAATFDNDNVVDNSSSLAKQWINFCWQPRAANQISLFTNGTSPILVSMNRSEYVRDLQNNVFLESMLQNLDKSEFLFPLPPQTWQQYQSLWEEMRHYLTSNQE